MKKPEKKIRAFSNKKYKLTDNMLLEDSKRFSYNQACEDWEKWLAKQPFFEDSDGDRYVMITDKKQSLKGFSKRIRRCTMKEIAELMKEIGYEAVAQEYTEGKYSAVHSLQFILGCEKNGSQWKKDVIKTALVVVKKENL